MSLTQAEIEYLTSQRLGRLATVSPDGQPQVNPTSFHYNPNLGTIDVGGYRMAQTKKFRNVAEGSAAAIVVDDLVSADPWQVRGIEVRGSAEVVHGQEPYFPGFTGDIVRIHPKRIISWGLEGNQPTPTARDV